MSRPGRGWFDSEEFEWLLGARDVKWVDLTDPEFLNDFELRQSGPISVIPTFLPSWTKACGDDGGGMGVSRGWFIIIAGNPGYGKCHGKGTRILMYDGSVKAVEDVVVGDFLVGDDSAPRRVLSLARGRDQMYEVRPTRGEPWTCNGPHVLTLAQSGHQGPWSRSEVRDIPLDDYMKLGPTNQGRLKLFSVAVDWPSRPVPIDPYFLGLWLGDGSSRVPAVTTADPEVEDAVRDYARRMGLNVRKQQLPNNRASTVYITTGQNGKKNAVTSQLRALGVWGAKHIPSIYMVNDRRTRLELLAGLLDTDGSLIKTSCFDFLQVRKRLADQVALLARSLGFRVIRCTKVVRGTTYYRLTISGDTDSIPIRIPRKRAAPRRQIKNNTRTGFTVCPLGEDDYYGFTLDGNGRYLLEDCTVTHNTLSSLMLLRESALVTEKAAFVSLEMHHHQLAARFYSIATGCPIHKLEKGRFDPAALDKVRGMLQTMFPRGGVLTNAGLLFRLTDIVREMRALAEAGVRTFVVDYLQLIGVGSEKELNEQITATVTVLRAFAVRTETRVILLSQFNRETSKNYLASPTIQGCHGGQMIEACADQGLLWDHSRYDSGTNDTARTWALLGKNKHGKRLEIAVEWDFKNLSVREADPDEVLSGWTTADRKRMEKPARKRTA